MNKLNSRAQKFEDRGDYINAERLFSKHLMIKENELGTEHPDLAKYLYELGLLSFALNKYEKAENLLARALTIQEKHLGSEHIDVIETNNALDWLYQEQCVSALG